MKSILVTGGAGFIGSHLVSALLAKNYKVTVLDNLIYGNRSWVPSETTFIEGDICDLAICHAAMQNIDGVLHCAAMSRAGPSLHAIELCTQVNVVGTQNVLLAARDAKVKKFIYSGSSTYYGNQPGPHHEYETPSQFLNTYALSKYVGEKYTLLFNEVFNVPSIVLRYFNVYGPRQPKEGEYALVLGIFLEKKALNQPLEIHGDGSQRRDFVHVNDVVAANIAALESDVRGEIFNVGSGTNLSINELANLISDKQIHCAARKGDAKETLADIARIKKFLQWAPSVEIKEWLQSYAMPS